MILNYSIIGLYFINCSIPRIFPIFTPHDIIHEGNLKPNNDNYFMFGEFTSAWQKSVLKHSDPNNGKNQEFLHNMFPPYLILNSLFRCKLPACLHSFGNARFYILL